MKKLILSLLLAVSCFQLTAATTSLTIASGVMTNIPLILQGNVKLTQIALASTGTNVVSVQFIDTYTNALSYTNAGYTNILSYATNYISTWTNYYGATNSWTNISLVDITNNVAGTTNLFPVRIIMATPTNTTTRIDSVPYFFTSGVWVTNTGTGNANLTVTYQQ